MRNRMTIKHGDLAKNKITVGPDTEGCFRLVNHFDVYRNCMGIYDDIEFAH